MSQREQGIAEAKRRLKRLQEKKEWKGVSHSEFEEMGRIEDFLEKQAREGGKYDRTQR